MKSFLFYMFLLGPFRNNNNNIFLCDIIREDIKQHDEILKQSVKNTTAYLKNVIGNKMENCAIEKITILNNQLEWIRKNLNN